MPFNGWIYKTMRPDVTTNRAKYIWIETVIYSYGNQTVVRH